MKRSFFLVLVSIMLAAFSSGTVYAELITNGGFESGDLSGWSCTGADMCDVTGSYYPAYEGSYVMFGFDNSGYATLSQIISTAVGLTYDFSFVSLAYQLEGNQLGYSFSGYDNAVFVTTTTDWAQTAGSFVATGTATPVEFYFATQPGTGTWAIDNVSVQLASPAAVPEPTTLMLMAFGLGGLGILTRIRK